ncbi:MAG: VWA domain-containing protein, partial [Bacteroidota bacterium]
GGSVEHYNDEAGAVWLQRLRDHFKRVVWLNPVPRDLWRYTQSIGMLRDFFEEKMYPLTLEGIRAAMEHLRREHG